MLFNYESMLSLVEAILLVAAIAFVAAVIWVFALGPSLLTTLTLMIAPVIVVLCAYIHLRMHGL